MVGHLSDRGWLQATEGMDTILFRFALAFLAIALVLQVIMILENSPTVRTSPLVGVRAYLLPFSLSPLPPFLFQCGIESDGSIVAMGA